MTDTKKSENKKLWRNILIDAIESITNAGEAHSELTQITEYLKSIACSLYVLAAHELEDNADEAALQ